MEPPQTPDNILVGKTKCTHCKDRGHNRRRCPLLIIPGARVALHRQEVTNPRGTVQRANRASTEEPEVNDERASSDEEDDPNRVPGSDSESEYLDPIRVEAEAEKNTEPLDKNDPYQEENWKDVPIKDLKNLRVRGKENQFEPMGPTSDFRRKGARNIPIWAKSPGTFLSLLFSESICKTFCEQTNSFVSKQANPAWAPEQNLTTPELNCGSKGKEQTRGLHENSSRHAYEY